MKILRLAFFLSAMAMFHWASGQSSWQIKAYVRPYISRSTTIFQQGGDSLQTYESRSVGLDGPLVAFSKVRENGSYHQFTLRGIGLLRQNSTLTQEDSTGSQIISGGITKGFSFNPSYEYGVALRKNREAAFQYFFAVFAAPWYSHSRFNPALSTQFATGSSTLGISFGFYPVVQYRPAGKSWFLEARWPFTWWNTSFSSAVTRDPAIQTNQQRVSQFNFEMFPNQAIALELGAGFHF